jgi:hypothetical protein
METDNISRTEEPRAMMCVWVHMSLIPVRDRLWEHMRLSLQYSVRFGGVPRWVKVTSGILGVNKCGGLRLLIYGCGCLDSVSGLSTEG